MSYEVFQKGVLQQVTPFVEKLRSSSIHYGELLLKKVLLLAGE